MNNDDRSRGEQTTHGPTEGGPKNADRRKFLSRVGMAAVAAGAIGRPSTASAQPGDGSGGSAPTVSPNNRVNKSYNLRVRAATQQANVPVPPHTTNGDEQRYADKCGTYSKGLLQKGPGIVDPHAWSTFQTALTTGKFSDFEKIEVGGTRTQNGPQAAFAFNMEGTDAGQFGNATCPSDQEKVVLVPPAPALASAAYGTELIELYWGSLLRDVAFTDYATNTLAAQACAELSAQPSYAGPKVGGQVTPQVLFRGTFDGETVGPYISQFYITPTNMGAQLLSQQLTTYVADVDYMTDLTTWLQVQNGIDTGLVNQVDPQPRYGYKGRVLSSYTHVDVLYQAYWTALMVLSSLGVPLNPGNPYVGSKTENGFATLGGPDFAGSLGDVAVCALKSVWYQKWLVHLRHRPESGGGIVHLIKTGLGNTLDGAVNGNVLNLVAVATSYAKYGSYLLSQAFPEGSPTHPAYPTGHGTVGGACITMLKFFFDGDYVIPNPLVPTNDGLGLVPYTGSDAGQMTVNAELNKLARNISFGHGIHAGIHWRSDTDYSMLLGEAVALGILRDKAMTYNEPFTVNITKLDGTTATITNK